MKVVRSKVLGFCAGVRIAVEKTRLALENAEFHVYSLGPLIHNNAVLRDLENRGLKILNENNLDDFLNSICEKSKVVIRAHGISPEIREKLEKKNISIIDATCPRVLESQKKVADFAQKGWRIFFAGDSEHAEVCAIEGCVQKQIESSKSGAEFFLLAGLDDAKKICQNLKNRSDEKKCVFLSQTTFSRNDFFSMAEILKAEFSSLEIICTICPATEERWIALENLAKNVDAVLVIGGKKSANSKRLFLRAKAFTKNVAFIENEKEIPSNFYDFNTVGICAGASAPDFVIENVEKSLKRVDDFR